MKLRSGHVRLRPELRQPEQKKALAEDGRRGGHLQAMYLLSQECDDSAERRRWLTDGC